MKILILTQKIDKDDPVLGFFHAWVSQFAKKCEKVTVICLGKGKYELPTNVKILSLGKEGGVSRLKYVVRFFSYLWKERKNYDTVFVHMNQEYLLLGGVIWRLTGKEVWMWRNHPVGSFFTDIAILFSNKVFCTSKYSYTARFKKTKLMPAGIDMELFQRRTEIPKIKHSILFLGRISAIKDPITFIEALRILQQKKIEFHASIVGDALPKEQSLYDELKQNIENYDLAGSVYLAPGVPNSETAELYNRHEIYVNLTPSGSLDKTILEAMSCENLIIAVNQSFRGVIPNDFLCAGKDAKSLAERIEYAFSLSAFEKETLGKKLRESALPHCLSHLVDKLFSSVG